MHAIDPEKYYVMDMDKDVIIAGPFDEEDDADFHVVMNWTIPLRLDDDPFIIWKGADIIAWFARTNPDQLAIDFL